MSCTKGPWYIARRENKYKTAPEDPREVEHLAKLGLDTFAALSIGTDQNQVAIVPLDESSRENAERIVSCVNAHDDLVATLREAEAQLAEDFEEAAAINTDQRWVDNITSVLGDVRDLLKKCGEID